MIIQIVELLEKQLAGKPKSAPVLEGEFKEVKDN